MCIQINPIMYVVYIVIIQLFMPLHDYGHREWLIKYLASCILWIRINDNRYIKFAFVQECIWLKVLTTNLSLRTPPRIIIQKCISDDTCFGESPCFEVSLLKGCLVSSEIDFQYWCIEFNMLSKCRDVYSFVHILHLWANLIVK